MEIGNIVNIMKYPNGYWKGKITEISDRYNETTIYSTPIANVEGNKGEHAMINKNEINMKDGEYWQFRI